MQKLRVLVVDDSVFMRKTISRIIACDTIEVIETAVNGKDAIEKIKKFEPDVVTLDIEMPIMNGLDALKIIMEEQPVPVIMVSTLTGEGADATLEAFSLGAVDFVTKKQAFNEMYSLKDELISKIQNVGNNRSLRNQLKHKAKMLSMRRQINTDKSKDVNAFNIADKLAERARQKAIKPNYTGMRKRPPSNEVEIIAIGISTGGPVALNELFSHLSGNIPVPIVIAQHMPPYFTKSLADRLNGISPLTIKEAEDSEKLRSGYAYIAPGGKQMTINKRMNIVISEEPKDELYKPSVNVLVNSIADVFGKKAVGIIMTGMGSDGRDSLKRLHSLGGYVISQDIDSCIVAGMTRSVIDAGIADEIHPLNDLAAVISSMFGLTAI